MPSQQKRPIEDFFRPISRSTPTIPQKRPSPSSADYEERSTVRKSIPKTPAKTVTFKNVTPKSAGPLPLSLLSPNSQGVLPIRSPRPKTSASPSPSKHRQKILINDLPRSSPKDAKQNVSFTFSDVSERSQKIIEDGKVVAVKDSDDDTDSLESLQDILGRKDAAGTSRSSLAEDLEAERVKTLSMFTSGRSVPIVGKDRIRALYAKEKAIKFDLSCVLDDHFEDEEVQGRISKMRADFDGAKVIDGNEHLDKDLLASLMKTGDADQEDIERLLNAVERTEALSSYKRFRFFKAGDSKPKSQRREAFPKAGIPDQLWTPNDKDAQARVYLSGYMSELAQADQLADEAIRWTFDQVVKEPQAELRCAYIDCLGAASRTWTRLHVTAADIQGLFQNLGADQNCFMEASFIEPKRHSIAESVTHDHEYLRSALRLLQVICPDMDFMALSKLTSIILRLTLDDLVMSNHRICIAVENLLEVLLSLPDKEARVHVYDRLLSDAIEHLHDPQLQVQLLDHLIPTTPQAKRLCKSLADAFLLKSSVVKPKDDNEGATMDDLSTFISTSPAFSLTRHASGSPIDYSALTALVQILDVAIISEDPTVPNTTRGSSPRKPFSAETVFDASIDNLADKLHTLFVSIKDTGASHMRRTEAKDALQALYFRLLFSVRTRPRKKKHVFDSGGRMNGKETKGRWVTGEEYREKEKGGDFMKRFLKR